VIHSPGSPDGSAALALRASADGPVPGAVEAPHLARTALVYSLPARAWLLHLAEVDEAGVAVVTDDDVIDHLDTDEVARGTEAGGERDVLR